MAYELAPEDSILLPTLPADRAQRRLALFVVLLSSAAFLALAPFAKQMLTPVWAFIPIYETALVVNDLITAILLFGQFGIQRSKAVLMLACGYLFTALMTVSHALSFPGLFAPGGLLGAGPQTTAWVYMFWHGGFPLFVIAYAALKRQPAVLATRRVLAAGVIGAALLALGLSALTMAGQAWLPPIMRGHQYTPAMIGVVSTVWLLSMLALLALWRQRPHSVLDIWLMVVLCAWMFDIALSAVLNQGRFDLGFYSGRIYGLLAASFVLAKLLLTNGALHAQLVEVHRREHRKNIDLENLRVQLEARARDHEAALEALHNKEEEIRAIVENLTDCVITIDTDGRIRSSNPALARTLGFTAEETLGRNISMLMPEPYRSRHDAYLGHYLRTGEARVIGIGREVEGLRKDGRTVPLELAISEYSVRGERYFIGNLRDISERKRFIAELTQARADAEQASRAKSAFLATMSHEIRTPMNGVIGIVELLAHSRLSEHQSDLVETIRESASTLLGIIDDILDFSKIEAGRLEIERAPVSIANLVEGLCNSLITVAARRGVDLMLFISPAIPERVLSDDVRLRQVLYNLVGNAIKFSAGRPGLRGRVEIRADVAQLSPLEVVFRVSDNGIGMSEETIEQLFTPFTQAEVSTTRRFGGTGLGLAICQRLVSLMRGEITVSSIPGRGSAFAVRLSFERAPGQPARSQPSLEGVACIVIAPADLDGNDLRTYLEHAGAEVDLAADADAAAARAAGRTAPVVLHDAGHGDPGLDRLRAAFAAVPDARFLILTRGHGRRVRVEGPDLLSLDGDGLRRHALLRAVAIAAGRASPDVVQESEDAVPEDDEVVAPTIAEARAGGQLILVAEDDDINQKVILRQLALLGYAAEVAGTGSEALQMWRSGGYALLLTDMHMPEMDGYTLASAIRREEGGGPRMPILALTANALRGEANRARAAGMDEYMTKPVQLNRLAATLEKWLPRARRAAAPAPAAVADGGGRPVVDLAVLSGFVGNNPETIQRLLSIYLSSLHSLAGEMRTALAGSESQAVCTIAHKLKSSSRSVGALALGDLCAEMENAGRAGDHAAIALQTEKFVAALAAVEVRVAELLAAP